MDFSRRNGDGIWATSGGNGEGGRENRYLSIALEQVNRVPPLHSTHLYGLLALCQGSSPGDTSLSSLVISTSLLNVSIRPCLLGIPRELTGVIGGLPEFCGKDKMHMLLV